MDKVTALAKIVSVDAKLTRTEVIDILIEEMRMDFERQIEGAQEELKKWTGRRWTHEEIKHLIPPAEPPTYELSYFSNDAYTFYMRTEQPRAIIKRDDPLIKDYLEKQAAAKSKLETLCGQRDALLGNRKALRAAILKRILADTKDGKLALAEIGAYKDNLVKQLTSGE